MPKFYSKTTGGFYSSEIHGKKIPGDAVEVAPESYASLMAAQEAGKLIRADANGAPMAVDYPAPAPSQLAKLLGSAVSTHIDQIAQSLGYDNILAAVSYADDATVPAYQAQGQALRAWRANVWRDAVPVINGVSAGTVNPVPTAKALIESLPVFVPPTVQV